MIRSMDISYEVTTTPSSITVKATHLPTKYFVTAVGEIAEGWTERKVRAEAADSLNSILSDD